MSPAVVAKWLRAYQTTLEIWQRKATAAQRAAEATIEAREAFIASLPELPAWVTERGEIGAECPEPPEAA